MCAIIGSGVVNYIGRATIKALLKKVLSNWRPNPIKYINVTFAYDWYRTKGKVLLPGASVKTIANRYQNYRAQVTFCGKSLSEVTQKKGNWWSGPKPY